MKRNYFSRRIDSMQIELSAKDNINLERNSRGYNFSVTLHSEDLIKNWSEIKANLDKIVSELQEKYSSEGEKK
jgi:hypothetical protein